MKLSQVLVSAAIALPISFSVACSQQPDPHMNDTGAAVAVQIAEGAPKLEIVGGDTHDWGKVSAKQEKLTTTVKIVNKGTGTLEIKEVKPGCGCTTAPIDKSQINSGDTARVAVTLSIGSATGSLQKSITIASNDPTSPSKLLMLKAEITRAVELTPSQYFMLNGMQIGQSSTAEISVRNTTKDPVVLSDFETTNNLKLNQKGKVTLKGGESIKLTASVTPDKAGYYNGKATMKTSHPDYPTLEISAYGQVTDPNAKK